MSSSQLQSEDPRRSFALSAVRTLRQAGFEALWAGGCVRDQLLGKPPKDYDVASTATPDDVIRIFGRRRTVTVGASFGVVMVLGPDRSAGQIEVATFRSDGAYLDGRRPSSVRFCRPEEDAKRRDFTINGMFFDPVAEVLIDYVGGRRDLATGIVRAIGDPVARFTEDKLRMLRAVRFTATLGFSLDAATADAASLLCQQLSQVSAERIALELKRMLSHASRAHSFRLLLQTGLLPEVFPELFRASDNAGDSSRTLDVPGLNRVSQQLEHLTSDQFEPALVLILLPLHHTGTGMQSIVEIESVCRRLKLSNKEAECVCWLADSLPILDGIQSRPLHILKPLLSHPCSELLLQTSAAISAAENCPAKDVKFCRNYLSTRKDEELRPPPFVHGQDLMALNVPQGPAFRILLSTIRNEQLDEILTTRIAALERLRELVNAGTVG